MKKLTADGGGGSDIEPEGIVEQEPEVYVEAGDYVLHATSVTIETDRYNKAARAEVAGLWEQSGTPPENGDIIIDVNGRRAFTGTIQSPSYNADGSVDVIAFDGVKTLKRTKINKTYNNVLPEQVVKDVAEKAGLDAKVHIEPRTPKIYASEESMLADISEAEANRHNPLSAEFDDTPATSVLGYIAKITDLLWWVDAGNTLHLGPPDPTVYDLGPSIVKPDSRSSKEPAPYRSVVVTGESPASTSYMSDAIGGRPSMHMISKDTIRVEVGYGKPTYRYHSKMVRTETQAKMAARAILAEFQKQRAGGRVTVVGVGEELRPNDVIKLPYQMGGEKYLVSKLTHRINNENGFISDIQVGGLIGGEDEYVKVPETLTAEDSDVEL